jgi:DNA-binding XRE family transcriptional regulator
MPLTDMLIATIKPVAPIGRGMARGFGHQSDGTPIYEWEMDIYPPSPKSRELRELRHELDLGLRETAGALGIRAVELSSLENGRATCDWELLFRMVRGIRHG